MDFWGSYRGFTDAPVELSKLLWIGLNLCWVVADFSEYPGSHAFDSGVQEFCSGSYFNVTCTPGHVLVMTGAEYGRMKAGKCITADHGGMGCRRDVLHVMDRKCSGRPNCAVYVPDPDFTQFAPCHKNFASYLEASYKCVPVAPIRQRQLDCSHHDLQLTEESGYVSTASPTSSIPIPSFNSRPPCPWTIRVKPGQKISLTLYNFNLPDPGAEGTELSAMGLNDCYEVARLTEGTYKTSLTTCNAVDRESLVHVSSHYEMQLELVPPNQLRNLGPFLIKYEATGCPNRHLPTNMWSKKEDNQLKVRCNFTEQSWILTCRGTTWIGEIGNCAEDPMSGGIGQIIVEEGAFPFGILILVAIGVALGVFLGGLLLSLAIFYLKRKQQRENPERRSPTRFTEVPSEQPKLLEQGESGDATWPRQSNYMATKQLESTLKQSLPPPPPELVETGRHVTADPTYGTRPNRLSMPTTAGSRSGHVYQSAQFS